MERGLCRDVESTLSCCAMALMAFQNKSHIPPYQDVVPSGGMKRKDREGSVALRVLMRERLAISRGTNVEIERRA